MTLQAVTTESQLFDDVESATEAEADSIVLTDSSIAPAAPTSVAQTGSRLTTSSVCFSRPSTLAS